jgi:hypothetical protein
MVEKPIVVRPFVWRFAVNALPQLIQNPTVKLYIYSLTSVYEFLVDNVLGVEKNDQHVHDIAANLTRFFRPQ